MVSKEEIDFQERLWNTPKDTTKNGIAQRVPLAENAALLNKVASCFSNSNWIFPSPQTNRPISGYGLAQGLRRTLKDSGLPHTIPHDLWRTAATLISALGFNRLVVVVAILNHKCRTVGGIYDRHTYAAQKRQALEAWKTQLEAILTRKRDKDGKIIDIRQARGECASMNEKQKDNAAGYLYDLSKGVALLTVIKPLWTGELPPLPSCLVCLLPPGSLLGDHFWTGGKKRWMRLL